MFSHAAAISHRNKRRLHPRRRVTLIAAFRCKHGIVMCADSQETVNDDYRVEVSKIKPETVGKFQIAIGGSGYIADLIDGFAARVKDALSKSNDTTEDGIFQTLRA